MALKFHTVEAIYADFMGRRTALIDALTDRVDEFYKQCDPGREGLCLYGFPSKVWEVNLPSLKYLADFPDPIPGINFLRDGMNRKDWISLIAVYSDSWLLSMAFYLGARLDRNERKRLFSLINDLPTLSEIVNKKNPIESSGGSGSTERSSDEEVSDERNETLSGNDDVDESYEEDSDPGSEALSRNDDADESYEEDSDPGSEALGRNDDADESYEEDSDPGSEALSRNDDADESYEGDSDPGNETLSGNDDADEQNEMRSGIENADEDENDEIVSGIGNADVVKTVCGSCGGNFNADQCWVCCDICDRLFHGKCVNVTPDEAESMEEYKCSSCS